MPDLTIDNGSTDLRCNLSGKHLDSKCIIVVSKASTMATAAFTIAPRPDLSAHRKAMSAKFPEILQELVSLLGRKLTAYIASVKDARAVDRWIAGESDPQKEEIERRLRLTYQVAAMIAEHDSAAVVQAWFIGLNPELDDAIPLQLLREGNLEKDGKRVLVAARAFVAGG